MAARSSRSEPVAVDPALPYKRRARRRLLGAVVLVAAVIAGVPFLLDPEPTLQRPEVVLDIPPRDTPLPGTGAAAADRPVTGSPQSPTTGVQAPVAPSASAPPPPPPVSAAPVAPRAQQPAPSPSPTPTPPAAVRPAPAASAPPAAPSSPVAGAPDRPPAAAASSGGRWVVQAGLFGRSENATAVAGRIRSIGLPVYTESIDGAQGPRVRVRVGPFASRAEADEARATLSLNGIEASLVSP